MCTLRYSLEYSRRQSQGKDKVGKVEFQSLLKLRSGDVSAHVIIVTFVSKKAPQYIVTAHARTLTHTLPHGTMYYKNFTESPAKPKEILMI